MGSADELRKLHDQHQRGGLTDEEFARARAALLGDAAPARGEAERAGRGRGRFWLAAAVLLLAGGVTLLVVGNNLTERTPRTEFPAGDVIYLSRDCGRLLIARGPEATLYDTRTGRELDDYRAAAAYTAAGFSPDGGTLALGQASGDTELWDVKTGQSRARFRAEGGHVQRLLFPPDGSLVVGLRRPPKKSSPRYHWAFVEAVRRWQAGRLGPVLTRPGRLSPDGRCLAEVSKDGIKVWDTASARLRCTLPVKGQSYSALAFSRDGTTLATQDPLRTWDTVAGKELARLADPPVGTGYLLLSPDGRLLLRREGLWEVRTGRKLRGPWNSFDPWLFTADGRWVVALHWHRPLFGSGGHSTHCLVDPHSGREQARVAHGPRPGSAPMSSFLALSADAGTLVTAHWENGRRGPPVAVRVWDWEPYWRGNPLAGDLRAAGWLGLLGAAVLGVVCLTRTGLPVWAHMALLFLAPLVGFLGGAFGFLVVNGAIFGAGGPSPLPVPLVIVCFLAFPFLGLSLALALVRLCPARCPHCGGRSYAEGNRPVVYRCAACGHLRRTVLYIAGPAAAVAEGPRAADARPAREQTPGRRHALPLVSDPGAERTTTMQPAADSSNPPAHTAAVQGRVQLMGAPASGPGALDWAAALLRALHPVRWLLCLAGVLATAGLNAVVTSAWGLDGTRLLDWWLDPPGKAVAVSADFADASVGGLVWAAAVWALNASPWCLIGCWVARHELLARRRRGADDMAEAPGARPVTATELLLRRGNLLLVCCPFVFVFLVIVIGPVLLWGLLNGLPGGVGALLASVLLPLALVLDLILAAVALGVPAWPLMPVAVAAECRDHFDAIARTYSYLYQCPVRYALLTAAALALAWLAFLGVAYLAAAAAGAGVADLPVAILFPAAALSVSVFWSLETLIYLHLRVAVDNTDAAELAAAPAPADAAKKSPGTPPPSAPAADAAPLGLVGRVRRLLVGVAALAAAWGVTIYLLARGGYGPTDWLDWGLTGWTTPAPAGGSLLYRAASWLAALWAVGSLLFLGFVAVRGPRRARKAREKGTA
jgi:WD40 repeat protein